MNITVYMGANSGTDPAFRKAAEDLGALIAGGGHTLVYGGSNVGLMGILANKVLAGGAPAIGIIPQFFVDQGHGRDDLTEQIVVETMQERKAIMLERGDVFVALPGGTGTLEEIMEAMTLTFLKRQNKPCYLLNINGYYDHLIALFEHMVECGLMPQGNLDQLHFPTSVEELSAQL